MPSDTEITHRHDWTRDQAEALFRLPFNDLIIKAQALHRRYFEANRVQMSRLLSVKTGGCPEDCAYCPQSAHFDTGVAGERLMRLDEVLTAAREAKAAGANAARRRSWLRGTASARGRPTGLRRRRSSRSRTPPAPWGIWPPSTGGDFIFT